MVLQTDPSAYSHTRSDPLTALRDVSPVSAGNSAGTPATGVTMAPVATVCETAMTEYRANLIAALPLAIHHVALHERRELMVCRWLGLVSGEYTSDNAVYRVTPKGQLALAKFLGMVRQ